MTLNSDKFQVIDPHCHLWDLSNGYNQWLGDYESPLLGSLKPLNCNYLPEDYEQDAVGFDVASLVHIEAASTQFAKDEMLWVEQLAERHPLIGAAVGCADLLANGTHSLLDFYSQKPIVKGVRQILNWHKNPKYRANDRSDDLVNPTWQRHFGLLQQYDLMFEMQIVPRQMQEAAILAKQYPDVVIVLNHAGLPIADEYGIWQEGVRALASCPNVFVKISGLGMLDHYWTVASIQDYIRFIIDSFGVERCMFASNFPVDKLFSDYHTLITSYRAVVADAAPDEQRKLFYSNAAWLYSIEN